jgi:two-component system, OmpR family, alkaline phosphatase synthesis response regulator PhoP
MFMPKILLVDDDKIASCLIENFLGKDGFNISTITDGQIASAFIKSNAETPDLVLMDLMLPFVNGFELLKLIRNSPVWQNIPVIMLTSMAQEKTINRAFAAGANDFIFKPFNREEVAQRKTTESI